MSKANFGILTATLLSWLMGVQSAQAYTRYLNRDWAVTLSYNDYVDLKSGSGNTVANGSSSLAPSYLLELEKKIINGYSVAANFESWTRTIDATGKQTPARTGYGLGFKASLPGIFFFGASSYDNQSQLKRYPVNSYLTGNISLVSSTNTAQAPTIKSTSTVIRVGAGVDVFLLNNYVYLNLNGGLLTFDGNAFALFSGGLGASFE